jgi:hypothetical protein
VGDFISASLGSLAHELGHVFDLGHSESGLMGDQFHRFRTVFSTTFDTAHGDEVGISRSCATILHFHRLGEMCSFPLPLI